MTKFLNDTGLDRLIQLIKKALTLKLDTITAGEGINLTNDNVLKTTGIPYGECDSTSTATAFTATVPGIYKLEDGVCCIVKNGVVTSASGFTLNINGLGAKPSYNNMTTGNDVTPTAPTRDTTIFNINYAMLFIYSETIVDGGGWICYRGYDANTNTIGYQLRHNSSTLPTTDKFYRYRLLFTSPDGAHYVPANTSTSTNATAKRDVNQRPINPFGEILYYSTTSAISAGSSPGATYLWEEYTFTLGYSFNRTGAALVLQYPKPIYIKCAPQADGSAIIDADNPYVLALPSTADGKIYIFLGIAYAATTVELLPTHPVYYHNGTGIRSWKGNISYNELTDKPTIPTVGTLDTNNSSALTVPTTPESFSNDIDLHKIAKTGTYSDLIGKPTVDSTPTTNSTNLVTSGGVKTYVDTAITNSNNLYTINASVLLGLSLSDGYYVASVTCDKTPEEAIAAYNNGKLLVLKTSINNFSTVYEITNVRVVNNAHIKFSSVDNETTLIGLEEMEINGVIADPANSEPASWYGTIVLLLDKLTFDNSPTANSNNPVKSSGIKTALDNKCEKPYTVVVSKDATTGTISTTEGFVTIFSRYLGGYPIKIEYQKDYGDDDPDNLAYGYVQSAMVLHSVSGIGLISAGLYALLHTGKEQNNNILVYDFMWDSSHIDITPRWISTKDYVDSQLNNIKIYEKVTYQELVTLRNNSELSPGTFYRITDYECTTTQTGTRSAGHQFDIVLLALDENKLAEEGWAMMHNNIYDVTFEDGVTKKCWIYCTSERFNEWNMVDCQTLLGAGGIIEGNGEDFVINEENKTATIYGFTSTDFHDPDLTYNYFQNSNLSAWKVWYCLDNDTTKYGWANGNTEVTLLAGIYLSNQDLGIENLLCVREPSMDATVGSTTYYSWVGILYSSVSGSPVTLRTFTTSETPQIGDTLYTHTYGSNYPQAGELVEGQYVALVTSPIGRGVIYRLIDEFNNDCPYDFKNIQFANEVYFPNGGLLKLKFERFDPHTSETTLNMYFYTFSLLNWETTTEYDEDSGEDITTSTFKNITDFSFGPVTAISQMAGVSFTLLGAYNNKIERPKMTLYQDEGYDEGRTETTESLPNNIILVDTIGEVSNCIFKDRAHNCLIYPIGKILNNIYDTEIGESCYNICIKSPGSDIKIARTCHDISIGSLGVNRIHIGSSSNNLNLVADGIINLIIEQESKYIKTLGDHINYVNIGNKCSDISIWDAESLLIGNKCSRIDILNARTVTIGDSCADIYFGEPFLDGGTLVTQVIPSTADDLPGYMPSMPRSNIEYKNIIIENINEKIFVSRSSSTSGYVYNLHILSYVGQPLLGTSSTTLSDYLQTENVITNTTSNLDTVTLIHKNSLTISV